MSGGLPQEDRLSGIDIHRYKLYVQWDRCAYECIDMALFGFVSVGSPCDGFKLLYTVIVPKTA